MENRLMTIVFVDMQGYTKRSATQTIEEMKLFHDQMFRFVSDIMEKWQGIMVKTMGDGFMIRFDSPTNAVQAGIELQRRLDARNAQMMNPDSIVRFRVGINSGEVGIDENGDLFGDPVNIAARIQTFADSNDVFISEATYLAMNRNEFGAVDLGNQDLKNATREIKIYKVLKNGAPGLTLSSPRHTGASVSDDGGRNKKIAMAVGAVLLVLLTLVIGIRLGRRGGVRAPVDKPDTTDVAVSSESGAEKTGAISAGQPAEVENDPTSKPDINPTRARTLLDIDPKSPGLPFDQHERQIFASIQKMRERGEYNSAEKKSAEMVYMVNGLKKVFWALALGQLFWEQKKTDKAEKVFANILEFDLLQGRGRDKMKEYIDRIKGSGR